ncbi:MAG: HAMP domain-containing histidine kinase [Prolixibacteraceae bacterium]|nr:HAMP domain-containing histidine kinase [Prolixibacteraceae bacterium]MBN2648420.1 HAMP domain-containing histidine kinase [Prolixibacteraceae bacterium]
MNRTKYLRWPFFIFVILLLAGITSEVFLFRGSDNSASIKSVSGTMRQKLSDIEKVIDHAAIELENIENGENFFAILSDYNPLLKQKELSLLIFDVDSLVYWSDNATSFSQQIADAEEGLLQLPNAWVTVSKKQVGQHTVYGLVILKYAYNINNNYLGNRFARGFNLPDNYEIQFFESENSYALYDLSNSYLFSIKPAGNLPCMYQWLYIPLLLFIAALFAFFILIYRLNSHFFTKHQHLKMLGITALLIGIYILSGIYKLPRSVHLLHLFSPRFFAYSDELSSLGDFILLSLLTFFWGICFSRTFNLSNRLKSTPAGRIASLSVLLLFSAILFVVIRWLIKILIMNSSISLAVYRIEEITTYSFAGFLLTGLLFLASFFILVRISRIYKSNVSLKEFFIVLLAVYGLFSILLLHFGQNDDFRLNIFFGIIAATIFYIGKKNALTHRLSLIVVFTSIYTLAGLSLVVRFDEKHEQKVQKLMAMNMTSEHDPTAELFLRDIDKIITSDTFLVQELYPPYDFIADYLDQTYFSGYFREYDIQYTICQANDSLIIQPENIKEPCMPFFDSLTSSNGSVIDGTNFYFLDNMNGRKTYFGKFEFQFDDQRPETSIFIELNSKLLSEGTGFPELLLPASSIEKRITGNYSFAKYNNHELVDRGGEYTYALHLSAYDSITSRGTSFYEQNDFVHCMYTSNNRDVVIVSRRALSMYDYLIAFPYLFIFLFGLSVIVNFITRPRIELWAIRKSLRLRIQTAIVGIVFMALLLVGTGTVYYNISQYQRSHREELINTIKTVSTEVSYIFSNIDKPDDELSKYLNYELIRMSDIFWTDINIFDTRGNLMATSRPEVFNKGLISTKMEHSAFKNLSVHNPMRFLHEEKIGSLKYISGYVPVNNNAGKIVAYLNLPYFTKEKEFRQDITTFILAFINLYVFLLLASILVAYFISDRITNPLRLIRENLSGMQLGKKTKPIQYRTDDEIGLLVSEYNKKLYELEESAELLARSERETAWREMAKQIAHEIKNPLTPMKLNIQFLQRTQPDAPDYNQKVEKVTNMLIEQIDNLSSIASEFSNFAKIPKANNVVFNAAQRLSETIDLYNFTGQVVIQKHFNSEDEFYVEADKEQFSRAIINLIRNGIQAIPENKKGIINIYLTKKNNWVRITIEDNGKGIPDNLKDSIFVPNFTTKSSGAGLGLAITRNIVETFKGKIGFESALGSGTKFYIELPMKQ